MPLLHGERGRKGETDVHPLSAVEFEIMLALTFVPALCLFRVGVVVPFVQHGVSNSVHQYGRETGVPAEECG